MSLIMEFSTAMILLMDDGTNRANIGECIDNILEEGNIPFKIIEDEQSEIYQQQKQFAPEGYKFIAIILFITYLKNYQA